MSPCPYAKGDNTCADRDWVGKHVVRFPVAAGSSHTKDV